MSNKLKNSSLNRTDPILSFEKNNSTKEIKKEIEKVNEKDHVELDLKTEKNCQSCGIVVYENFKDNFKNINVDSKDFPPQIEYHDIITKKSLESLIESKKTLDKYRKQKTFYPSTIQCNSCEKIFCPKCVFKTHEKNLNLICFNCRVFKCKKCTVTFKKNQNNYSDSEDKQVEKKDKEIMHRCQAANADFYMCGKYNSCKTNICINCESKLCILCGFTCSKGNCSDDSDYYDSDSETSTDEEKKWNYNDKLYHSLIEINSEYTKNINKYCISCLNLCLTDRDPCDNCDGN
jgi:hypothetical protein